jgi:deoxyribodipyrimidine photo-lyase
MVAPALMWFRQDLRLADNSALAAAAAAGPVIAVYILDDATPKNWHQGAATRWWLHKSLESLSAKIPVLLRQGKADLVLEELLAETGAKSLHFSREYAPWSAALEQRIKNLCESHGISCHRYGGFLLHEPEKITTGAGGPYKIYTPFSRACFASGEPRLPKPAAKIEFAVHAQQSDTLSQWQLLPSKPNWAKQFETIWHPGEEGAAQNLFSFLDDKILNYAEGRDRADQPFTSRLSPHLHFGEISPHNIWFATRNAMAKAEGKLDRSGEKFLKEILWREFSYHVLHHFPHVVDQPFKPEFSNFPWQSDAEKLALWQKGQTGFPIVDAGMRELWQTGTMHNRVRMIAASFLIKDLLISWVEGARWFWECLVDADIGANSASWQWVAGCGTDASPYFRIFNPVLQGEKFDPEGAYVKKWVPELQSVPPAFIHRPWELPTPPKNYSSRMIDHAFARGRALEALKSLSKN